MKSSRAVTWIGVLGLGIGAVWAGTTASGCLTFGVCGAPCEGSEGGGTSTSTTITTTGPICTDDATCEEEDNNPCTRPTCMDGECTEEADDSVIPSGGSECRILRCDDGTVAEDLPGDDTGCGADPMKTHCNGMGDCIGCTTKKDCLSDTDCQTWECVDQKCESTNAPAGPLPDDQVGDCTKRRCDGNGGVIPELDDADKPPEEDPPNPCTEWTCPAPGTAVNEIQNGLECGAAASCMGSVAKAHDQCDAAGVCQPGALTGCAPFACDTAAGACKTTCTQASEAEDCINGYCDGTTCKTKLDNGAPCTAAGQCDTGFCVDDVCCVAACDTDCLSCKLGGAMAGVCLPLPKGIVDTCTGNEACSANGACADLGTQKAVGQPCSTNIQCFNWIMMGFEECRNGLCRLPSGAACEPMTYWYCETKFCDEGVCTTCDDDGDCGSGGVCAQGVGRCQLGTGGVCGNNNDCVSNICDLGSGTPGTCE